MLNGCSSEVARRFVELVARAQPGGDSVEDRRRPARASSAAACSSIAPEESSRIARFVSTSKPASGAETSLATMRSTPLARELLGGVLARRRRSRPRTRRGPGRRLRGAERRRGCRAWARARSRAARRAFFSFSGAAALGRKSATAAAMTTTSASGEAAEHRVGASPAAVSTRTTSTPAGTRPGVGGHERDRRAAAAAASAPPRGPSSRTSGSR